LLLPAGFTSRVVAVSEQEVEGTGFVWPVAPDGGATFPVDDEGWIYVSNSEWIPGGASMIRFDRDGEIVEARSILDGTARNCAGGATPWGTWLSCEEIPEGLVFECDPTGATPAVPREAMGRFNHEAAACDDEREVVYLTEDDSAGALYRFVPASWGDLATGELQVLVGELDGDLSWAPVPDPSAAELRTADQVEGATRFDGGEGADVDDDGVLWFTTKGDNRLWRMFPGDGDTGAPSVEVTWDGAEASGVVVEDVDNVVVRGGVAIVAEDGPGLQVVVVDADGTMRQLAQVTDTPGSEITGPAFSPDGTRLYFSSQREPGRTYEVTGPFEQLG
jgi:secreted PhoX family phosphatase